VFLLVINASFTSVMHVYDDCSAVHASINVEKKQCFYLPIFSSYGISLEPKRTQLRGMPICMICNYQELLLEKHLHLSTPVFCLWEPVACGALSCIFIIFTLFTVPAFMSCSRRDQYSQKEGTGFKGTLQPLHMHIVFCFFDFSANHTSFIGMFPCTSWRLHVKGMSVFESSIRMWE
jgi:hypothetical protein